MTSLTPERIISLLELKPMPVEGGYFRRTYASSDLLPQAALPSRYSHAKAMGSAIYYLLHGSEFSALHRLLTDEIYHYYLGDPVEMLLLPPGGAPQFVRLGPDLQAGERVQFVVPRGVWQGSRLAPGGQVALLGNTLAPEYDVSDFELGDREALLREFPSAAEWIRALTRV